MGKLVLTRRAGESVKLTEPNGDTWQLRCRRLGTPGMWRLVVTVHGPVPNIPGCDHSFFIGPQQSATFAGGNVELRPHKRPDQAILAFDFPRDVTIVRTEIA